MAKSNTLPTLPSAPEIAKLIHYPYKRWSHDCHGVSIRIVRSNLFPISRVARGRCAGVISQHSWVVVGNDCYDRKAPIVDPTLWSYDESVEGIWTGTLADGRHHPHGEGNIWKFGKPPEPVGEPVTLAVPVSWEAQRFLDLCGPLDVRGWAFLASSPVEGWPASEIVAAMDDTPGLSVHVPIDILGMLTDRNPSGLYLKGKK